MAILVSTMTISCVGTQEESQLENRKVTTAQTTSLTYPGISVANGIADTKIEVYFPPYVGTDEVQYLIYINYETTPVFLNESTLEMQPNGDYRYTLTDLNMATTYQISVEVYSPVKNIFSENKKTKEARTFSNVTAKFDGVQEVITPPGKNGRSSLIVKWSDADFFGSISNLKEYDPIAYEIIFISEVGGVVNLNNSNYTGSDRVVIQYPSTLSSSPGLFLENEFIITGLQEDRTYFVQVRCIHYGYHRFKDNQNYRREANTKSIAGRTNRSGEPVDFNSDTYQLKHPPGVQALSAINAIWGSATGDFSHYRLYYQQVASDSPPYFNEEIIDQRNGDINYIRVDSTYSAYLISSLQSYKTYEVVLAICISEICEQGNRFINKALRLNTEPVIAPFSGITNLYGPINITPTEIDKLYFEFQAPVTTSGYLNKTELYCYNPNNYNDFVLMEYAIPVALGHHCQGLYRNSKDPTSFNGFTTYESMNLRGIEFDKKYCFSIIPVVDESGFTIRNMSAAVIKCTTPTVVPPTLEQFSGKKDLCKNEGMSLKVEWVKPLNGMYDSYIVFWKEKNSEFFNFQKAIEDFENGDHANGYFYQLVSGSALDYTINDLPPNRNYHTGVLTHLQVGTDHYYSELNTKTRDCNISLPMAQFELWHDLFAIGPKEDGLFSPEAIIKKKHIVETLDQYGLPVEAHIDDAGNPINDSVSRSGLIPFDGIYGAIDGDPENLLHQYSNSGIVRLAWEDVRLWVGSPSETTLLEYANNATLGEPGVDKKDRTIGYKVFRSSNNKSSWIDLTDSMKTQFQTTGNSGLVLAKNYRWRKKLNATPTESKVVFFTDYSVKHAENISNTERARIYWYKIVPYIYGKELTYSSGNIHIIKVVLPPANMALVHRMTANKTVCDELGKEILKGPNEHYACYYNGIGSSTLSYPWAMNLSVYDLGGDLLVDRYEMGCHFSRGNSQNELISSLEDTPVEQFQGLNDIGGNFQGCYNRHFNSGSHTPPLDYRNLLRGDCLGTTTSVSIWAKSTTCSSYPVTGWNTDYWRYLSIPGLAESLDNEGLFAHGYGNQLDCSILDNILDTLDFDSHITQSEFGAVFFDKSGNYTDNSGWRDILLRYSAPEGKKLTNKEGSENRCKINLSYVGEDGNHHARWLDLKNILGNLKTTNGEDIAPLYKRSITDIANDTNLYGIGHMLPSRTGRYFADDEKLINVMVSNASKLPPVSYLSINDAQTICKEMNVETGYIDSTGNFVPEEITSKRLLRRKEYVASSSFPKEENFSTSTALAIEKGNYITNPFGSAFSTKERSCNGPTHAVSGVRGSLSYLGVGNPIRYNAYATTTGLIPAMTGSSRISHVGGLVNSTEGCTSRFGIQDLIGNLYEVHGEQFFCHRNERLMLGYVAGESSSSVPFSTLQTHIINNPDNNPLFIDNPGNLHDFNNASYGYLRYDSSSLVVWAELYPDSGQCSAVEYGGSRSYSATSSGVISTIYKSEGVINPAVVPVKNSQDVENINDLRNGDGYFLDFGQNNLLPPISRINSLGVKNHTYTPTSDPRQAPFFNPALGIPIYCGGINGLSCLGVTDDNLLYTTSYQLTKFTELDPDDFQDPDFPIGNAEFKNISTSSVSSTTSYSYDSTHTTPFHYITAVDTSTNKPIASEAIAPTVSTRVFNGWNFGLTEKLTFYSGGVYSDEYSGRYSINADKERITISGVRCMAKINRGNY